MEKYNFAGLSIKGEPFCYFTRILLKIFLELIGILQSLDGAHRIKFVHTEHSTHVESVALLMRSGTVK
jgi:hypothetical protein